MRIKRALPVMAVGVMTLLCLPAVAWGGDALVDGPAAVRSIPTSAAAAFARGQADYAAWLDPRNEATQDLARLFVPSAAPGLLARPVSRRVNDARNQGADLVLPLGNGPDRT